ncbi:MAG: ATP-binding protein [Desulfovibrio sp.]|uniref:ATP-binding protein n=1 Tax=Desulfovibrio sp. 7SRBS1 TaxID=3378064 RepID=UPI003B3C8419
MMTEKPSEEMTRKELLEENLALRQCIVSLQAFRDGLGRAETFIRESDFRYRMLFENSPISLWEEDLCAVNLYLDELRAKGVHSMRAYFERNHPAPTFECLERIDIIHFNNATVRLFEADGKDSLISNLNSACTPTFLNSMRERFIAMAEGATEFFCEQPLQTLQGNRKHCILHVCLVPGPDGSAGHGIVSLIDITDRKRLENKLHAATMNAQKANQLKSRILANMSHEIRTPMNAILGMADLLWETPLSPKQQTYVQIFRKAGENLLGIINDILDLSRIEAGKIAVESLPFAPSALVKETCMILRAKAEDKGLRLQYRISPHVPLYVLGDPTRVQQILINFIDNALKFTHKGGVEVDVAPVRAHQTGQRGCLGAIPAGDACNLAFRVADTGIGIASDMQECIFQSFCQADDSTTRRYGGTGLGLTICRELAELLGGEVQVESTPGQGSVFTLIVPFLPVQQHAALPYCEDGGLDSAAPRASGRRILLAEDCANNRMLVEFYLKRSPHSLFVVENGRKALDAVKQQEFDIILMDIQMPDMDGHAATREIRRWEAEHGERPVPILALSAHAFDEDRQNSLAAGCNGHLTKPIKKRTLLDAIDQFCS